MFSFAWPWAAALLPLPLLIRWLWPSSRTASSAQEGPERTGLLHPAVSRLELTYGVALERTNRAERVMVVLLALAWVSLVAVVMRPQWLEEHSEVVSRGYDLMLAVDGSRSMEAMDFSVQGRQVTRMAVIKGVVGRFIDERDGDRIGLLIFGDQAYVMSPLTVDNSAVRSLLDSVVPRMAGDGTAMGDAIGLAIKKFRERPEESRVLVLVTDGENTSGSLSPRLAAELAARDNIRIYTIGVGSMGLVPFMERGQMTRVRMEIDEELLKEVASLTGGAYFRATDTRALEEIYRRIDEMVKTEAESQVVWLPNPLYRWPLGVGMTCLLLLGLFPGGYLRVRRRRALAE